jgi:hypothetical protein
MSYDISGRAVELDVQGFNVIAGMQSISYRFGAVVTAIAEPCHAASSARAGY